MRQDTLVRIALGNITDALAEVASFVYLSGGTTALRKGSPIERLVRDVHAGTQHITSGPGMWRAAARRSSGPASTSSGCCSTWSTPLPRLTARRLRANAAATAPAASATAALATFTAPPIVTNAWMVPW